MILKKKITMRGKISLILLIVITGLLLFQLLYHQPKEAMYDLDHPFWTYLRTMIIIEKVLSFPASLFIDESNTSAPELIVLFSFMILNPFVIGYSIGYFYRRYKTVEKRKRSSRNISLECIGLVTIALGVLRIILLAHNINIS